MPAAPPAAMMPHPGYAMAGAPAMAGARPAAYPPMGLNGFPPPPREGWGNAERVEPVPETPFAVVHLEVPAVVSGLAIGSLVTGGVALLVSFAVACFGLLGAQSGWGGLVAGAFALLAVIAGVGAVVQGTGALRQVRRPAESSSIRFSGRGLAITGLSLGGGGAAVALLSLLIVVVLSLS
ncbi:hypothetical protein J2S43_007640 [Catenuloplanes nepalensis]|uniref:Uncharacterized protein n=1 Tax=Catenuloplanes nepalensis TaxID=587533 RepID=A0ABT9N6H6_9ACTN|nr:hypothetical protein [Catenuloplanes nepalensis]MDP9799128.1 hypothetical protein [Catenuloplanes nepalensis]